MEIGKYTALWKKYLPALKIQLKKSFHRHEILELNKTEFETVGDRDSSGYTFNLEIEKGKVTNDISGTAVARDLYKVLNADATLKGFFKDNKVKISMGKTFVFKIKVAST